MTKQTYNIKASAIRGARRALKNASAEEGVDFKIVEVEGRFSWEPIKKAPEVKEGKIAVMALEKKEAVKKINVRENSKATKADAQSMADRCVELAQRPCGVTPTELNEMTGWQKAPWKWLFTNPKGTGWCDRRGLKFSTSKREDEGSTRKQVVYHVSA